MAFADKKGIVVASPFKLQAESLLDVRQQVDTLTERDELVTIKAATAGLRVYVKETKKSYVYNGTSWDTLTIGGNAALTVTLNSGTTEGTNKFTYNGTAAKTVNITPSSIGAAAKSHTHASTDITGLPSKLPNPQPLRFTGVSSASYDGSSAVTVNIPVTSKVPNALVIKLNGGSTEGTNMFTFDGGAAKSINITPSTIGAAAATHTHNANQITGLTAGKALISDTNGHPAVSTVSSTELGYLAGVTSGIQSQLNGKAAANHTHNYAGSSSAGGAANSAVKLTTARTLNGVSFDGTANIDIPNNYFKNIASATDINSLRTYGEYYAAGGSGCKNIPDGVDNFYLRVFRCADGYTGQELYYNGKTYKRYYNGTIWSAWDKQYSASNKPTASEIGAATSSHTHTASQITGLPTSLKNPYALTFAGAVSGTYDGSKAVTITIPTTGATTKASLVVQLNGGTTEGTNQFTFNGGTAKTINITPSSIGAATSGHTHNVASTTANGFLKQLDGSTSHFMRGDGTWATPPNTTYSAFKGATSSAAGGTGLVPAPAAGAQAKYLRGDSTWQAITPSSIGAAASSHTHTSSQISDFSTAVNGLIPSTRPNPYAITFTGATTGTYDGSKAVTINIPTTGATSKESLVIKLNSGSTEGTNMFTFNGGTAKTVNITPSAIGAAAASHGTHVTYSTAAPAANGTASAGSASTVARSDHVHPLQTTVSGNAGSATKLATPRTIDGVSFNGTANITHYGTCATAAATAAKVVSCTGFTLATGAKITVKFTVTNTAASPTLNVNNTGAKAIQYRGSAISAGYLAANRVYTFIYDGTAYQLIGDINTDNNTTYSTGTSTTAGITKLYTATGSATDGTMTQKAITDALSGKAASSHTHNYAGSSSAGGSATSAVKVNNSLIVKLNSGSTEGTNMFTFNGSTAKTINITPSSIGAAAASHGTHVTYSTAAPLVAGTASAGSASTVARSDHVHPAQTSVSGNAGTATKLQTKRTINDVSFDGTANITLNSMYAESLVDKNVSLNNYNLNTGKPTIKWYTCPTDGGGDGITGRPNDTNKQAFLLKCESIRWASTTDYITKQTYIQGSTNTTYERYCVNGTWKAWGEVYTSNNKPTASEIGAAASSHNHSASNITSGTLPVARGGTGLTASPSLLVNLASTSAASVLTASPRPGITGTLPVSHGGTGATTALAANYNILSSATENTAGFSDSTMLAYFTGSPSTSVGAVRRYKAGNVWSQWLKAKTDAAYAAKSHTHNYAGSSSAGGAANSANRVPVPVGTVLFATSSSTSFFNSCFGGTWEIVGNIDAIVGNGTAITLYLFKKTKA